MTGKMSCYGLGNTPAQLGIECPRTGHSLLLHLLVSIAREDLREPEYDRQIGRTRLDRGSEELTSPLEILRTVQISAPCEQGESTFAAHSMRRIIVTVRSKGRIRPFRVIEEEAQACTQ